MVREGELVLSFPFALHALHPLTNGLKLLIGRRTMGRRPVGV